MERRNKAIAQFIFEMISNKEVAQKAVERDYGEFTKAMNALNQEVKNSAITGIPIDPKRHAQLVQHAEKTGARYERFKRAAHRKFGIKFD